MDLHCSLKTLRTWDLDLQHLGLWLRPSLQYLGSSCFGASFPSEVRLFGGLPSKHRFIKQKTKVALHAFPRLFYIQSLGQEARAQNSTWKRILTHFFLGWSIVFSVEYWKKSLHFYELFCTNFGAGMKRNGEIEWFWGYLKMANLVTLLNPCPK